ncbi:hypothetical protein [Gordonia malaquae]|nr:hypothetical protein [Gordonia malaquae]
MTDQNLRATAREHGGRPVGLYLWEGEKHEVYIGISNDSIVKRLRRHLVDYGFANIQNFRYLEHSGDRPELRDIEREFIHEAIRSRKLTVFNTEHASSVLHDTAFDELIVTERQIGWLADPAGVNLHAPDSRRSPDPNEISRSQKNFTRLLDLPEADAIIDAVSIYLRTAVPFPAETEATYWAVSALPALRVSPGYTRIVTVNMGILEMLWISRAPNGDVIVDVGTHYQFLPARGTRRRLKKHGATMQGVLHTRGGADEEVLRFASIQAFVSALGESEPIRRAAARFALDRMRAGKLTRHAQSHNYLLAEQALNRLQDWSILDDDASRPQSRSRLWSWMNRPD